MRFFVAMIMALLLMGCSSANSTDESVVSPDDLAAYHEEKYFDAFVISKGINNLTTVDELSNNSGKVIVSLGDDIEKSSIRALQINDHVRIWYDFILESYPAKTKAYRIEVLDE